MWITVPFLNDKLRQPDIDFSRHEASYLGVIETTLQQIFASGSQNSQVVHEFQQRVERLLAGILIFGLRGEDMLKT